MRYSIFSHKDSREYSNAGTAITFGTVAIAPIDYAIVFIAAACVLANNSSAF